MPQLFIVIFRKKLFALEWPRVVEMAFLVLSAKPVEAFPESEMSAQLLLTLLAAAVAHITFLEAPEALNQASLYGLAAISTVFVAWKQAARNSNRLHLLAHSFCTALVLVGAGYSTAVEPGVIKLFGEIPLGWTAAVLLTLIAQATAVDIASPGQMTSFAQALAWRSLALLALSAAVTAMSPPGKEAPRVLEIALLLVAGTAALHFVLTFVHLARAAKSPKE